MKGFGLVRDGCFICLDTGLLGINIWVMDTAGGLESVADVCILRVWFR